MIERSPDHFMKEIERANKGRLKIYIGGAPGVGKTYHMLRDAAEMKLRSIDVIAGFVESYGRKDTIDQIGDLEIMPMKIIDYKGVMLKEMDLEGIIKRRPQVVIVDELAHTNMPTSKNKKRYQDVLEIIESGINVMSAVNIQHIESLNDYVNRMTGIKVRETIPDSILEQADEVMVIDVTPDTLRERLANGKIYTEDKVHTALHNFFRVGNLIALRELTLREVANDVDEKLMEYKNKEMVDGLVGAQEKILVCVSLKHDSDYLIRRGYRLAKMQRAKLYVLYVYNNADVTSDTRFKELDEITSLSNELGAEFQVVRANDPTDPIIDFAKANGITQVIIGQSARTRFHEIIKGSIARRIMRGTKYVDVLVVADPTGVHEPRG